MSLFGYSSNKRERVDASGQSGINSDRIVLKRIKINPPDGVQGNSRTQTLQDSDGVIALTSQIPSTSNFVTFNGVENITGLKTFIVPPSFAQISNVGTITIPTSTGTLALLSDIVSLAVTLTGSQTISGVKTFSSSPVISSITNTGTLSLPSSTGTLLLSPNSFGTIVSGGLSLSDNISINNSSYLEGTLLNLNNSTITDTITASSGTVAQVADVVIGGRTYTASNSSVTYTSASSLRIKAAPTAGANVTISNRQAILVDSGNITLTNGRYQSASSGLSSAPVFSIGSAGGIYSSAANTVNIATGGTLRCSWSNTTQTLAANYALTCSGTATITSGSGGFTSAGPVSSSLVSSAATCSIRPSNNVNTGIFGTGTTSVGISIAGTQVGNFTSTGLSVTGISSSTTSVTTPLLRPISGTQILACPSVDSAAGAASILISPSSTAWASGGVGQLFLGDTNHFIRATNGTGVVISTFNSIQLLAVGTTQIGSNGNGVKDFRQGTSTFSIPIAGGTVQTSSISFGVTFASVPKVFVSLNGTSGSQWEHCSAGAFNITTTAFDVIIRNNSGTVTSGSIQVVWEAITT